MYALVRHRRSSAFTLIELMIVVVIVAILALVAIPLYSGNVKAARMSEGIAGVGSIRSALRVYAAGHAGSYPTLSAVDGTGLTSIGVASTDLTGKYFAATNYSVTSAAATYTIRATLPASSGGGGASDYYEINQLGVEATGGYTTGN